MKKFIFLVMIFFIGFDLVSAKDYYVVDNDSQETYFFKDMVINDESYFFLTLSDNYNFNIDDYYEVFFDRSLFPKYIDDIISYDSDFYYSNILFQMYLLNYLYDMDLELLNPEDEEAYVDDKTEFNKLMNVYKEGFWYNEYPKIFQKTNSTKDYHSDYMHLFRLNRFAREVEFVDDSTIRITTEYPNLDSYSFIRNDNGKKARFLTDGENYLISYGKNPLLYYVMQINSILQELKIVSEDENNNPLDNLCYDIYQNGVLTDNKCTKNGIAVSYLPDGKYQIIRNNHIDGYVNEIDSYNVHLKDYKIITDTFSLKKEDKVNKIVEQEVYDIIEEIDDINNEIVSDIIENAENLINNVSEPNIQLNEVIDNDYEEKINLLNEELDKSLNKFLKNKPDSVTEKVNNTNGLIKKEIDNAKLSEPNNTMMYTYNYYQSPNQLSEENVKKDYYKYMLIASYVVTSIIVFFLIKSVKNYKKAKKS